MPSIPALICGLVLSVANLVRGVPEGSTTLAASGNVVNLRVEGAVKTFYEGPIYSTPRNITTSSTGTHICDGTNNGENIIPGPTCTTALDAWSKLSHVSYDARYDAAFDDFIITRIATDTYTDTRFWLLILDNTYVPTGCRVEVTPGQNVLWFFGEDAVLNYFLKVTPNAIVAKAGSSHVVTVTDLLEKIPIEGATIAGALTDANGKATLKFPKAGSFKFKAERNDSVRSNTLYVTVA